MATAIDRSSRNSFDGNRCGVSANCQGGQSFGMVQTTQDESELAIDQVVSQVLTSKQMKRQEHLFLTSIILANRKITVTQRKQINRLFDRLKMGQLRLVD